MPTPETPGRADQGQRSRNRLLAWAVVTLLVGLAPIFSSLLVEIIAPSLGCLVIEHGAYTKLTHPEEYYGSNLRPGCFVAGANIGPALHAMHLFIFAILITWPAIIASMALWIKLAMGVRRG